MVTHDIGEQEAAGEKALVWTLGKSAVLATMRNCRSVIPSKGGAMNF